MAWFDMEGTPWGAWVSVLGRSTAAAVVSVLSTLGVISYVPPGSGANMVGLTSQVAECNLWCKAKQYPKNHPAISGAIAGGVAGSTVFPGVGTVVGIVMGATVGHTIGSDEREAAKAKADSK